ncbi:MAG: hypothetical protein E7599_00730 [Ruminococcaceae bacterium]|nr:hypothetical protein [Oscillospiraceae bacterium]
MKKRIISFLLCMLMLAGTALSFAGCGDESQKIYSESKPKAMTISITTVYDYDENSASQREALKQVQDALNLITETKYNTHVVINAMSSEDYMETVLETSKNILGEVAGEEEPMKELTNAKSDAEKTAKRQAILDKRKYASKYQVYQSNEWKDAANTDKVYLDENGRYKTIYPSVDKEGNYNEKGAQLDIVLVNSAEMYNKMVFNNYLYLIDSTLSGDSTGTNLISKFVNEYVHDYVDMDLSASDETSDLYAVPNNAVFGEYGYIVVNKKLFDAYGYDINFDYSNVVQGSKACDDFSDFENFVMNIAKDVANGTISVKDEYKDSVSSIFADKDNLYPVLNNPNLEFRSIFGADSVLIADATSKFNMDATPAPKAITDSRIFKSYFRTMYTLTQTTAYSAVKNPITAEWLNGTELLEGGKYENANFGVALGKGNLNTIERLTEEKGDDYYVAITHTPYIDDNVYESMYAISSCIKADPFNGTERAKRCYQILELFATNAEWVNILTYGVQGEHYEISTQEPGLVINRSDDYKFNRRYAGNMFLQYVSEDMSDEMKLFAANGWELGRKQNQNLSVSPYAGFTVATQGMELQDDFSEKLVDLTIEMGENEFTVADVMKRWYEHDAGLKALLSVNGENAFADLKKYQEVTGGSLDDYLSFFKSAVIMQEFKIQADYKSNDDNKYKFVYDAETGNKVQIPATERIYEIATGSHLNNPLSQYTDFFSTKRDMEGSYNLFK